LKITWQTGEFGTYIFSPTLITKKNKKKKKKTEERNIFGTDIPGNSLDSIK
jgi:hypothetical protein